MKKYLTVNYAYPVYFLLILGQYFLAEGLDLLYHAPAHLPAVAQPVQNLPDAPAAAPGAEKVTIRTLLWNLLQRPSRAVIQALTAAKRVSPVGTRYW